MSDVILNSYGYKDAIVDYLSMQYALYVNCYICVIGGGFFLGTAIYIDKDRRVADLTTKGIFMRSALVIRHRTFFSTWPPMFICEYNLNVPGIISRISVCRLLMMVSYVAFFSFDCSLAINRLRFADSDINF